MRAFVAMRRELATHAELSRGLDALEAALASHEHAPDAKFDQVFEALRALLRQPAPPRNAIGFTADLGRSS